MQFTIYYIVVSVLMCVMLYYYRRDALAELILLITFTGVFDFFIPRGTQYLNIVKVAMVTYLCLRTDMWPFLKKYRYVVFSFLIFSVYFLWTNLLYNFNEILMVFSQYSKYYVTFLIFCLFLTISCQNSMRLYYYNALFWEVMLIQILVSVFRYALLGGYWEGMVGTFGGLHGGGAGTGLPLIALCWVALNTNMQFSKGAHWLFVVGLLMIGIATGKRAVILLFPMLFLVLAIYVCRQRYNMRNLMLVVLLIPALLYFGVRITPSLNPDGEVWGRFDLEHLIDYTRDYSGGATIVDNNGRTNQMFYKYEGRLGAVRLLWDKIIDVDHYDVVMLYGEGVQKAYTSAGNRTAYDKFGQQYGLNHRGEMTGIFFLYIAVGLIGVAFFIVYVCALMHVIPYKRLRWPLLGVVLFDFIFYNGTIVRDSFVCTVLVFTIVFARLQYTANGQFVGFIHPFFVEGVQWFTRKKSKSSTMRKF